VVHPPLSSDKKRFFDLAGVNKKFTSEQETANVRIGEADRHGAVQRPGLTE
jgi:hypothetical protein